MSLTVYGRNTLPKKERLKHSHPGLRVEVKMPLRLLSCCSWLLKTMAEITLLKKARWYPQRSILCIVLGTMLIWRGISWLLDE
jgi:hypothetical protein